MTHSWANIFTVILQLVYLFFSHQDDSDDSDSKSHPTPDIPGSNEPENKNGDKNSVDRKTETKSPPNIRSAASCDLTNEVPSTALDILSKLFPEKKKSVLELVLRRCGDDLLKAIEQCNPQKSAEFNYFDFGCRKNTEKYISEKMKSKQFTYFRGKIGKICNKFFSKIKLFTFAVGWGQNAENRDIFGWF